MALFLFFSCHNCCLSRNLKYEHECFLNFESLSHNFNFLAQNFSFVKVFCFYLRILNLYLSKFHLLSLNFDFPAQIFFC